MLESQAGEPVEVEIGDADAGARLDVVLVRRVEGMSRREAKRLIDAGKVRVNGRRARKGAAVGAGDRIVLEERPLARTFEAAPDPAAPLEIIHEDRWIVAVSKPAGMPSHPLRPGETGTLAGALVARYPEMASVGYSPREPGIIHRLDTDTSGLVLAARDVSTFDTLREALEAGRIEKRYIALCAGQVDAPRTVSIPLAPHPRDKRKVLACEHARDAARYRARPAVTEILQSEPTRVEVDRVEVDPTRVEAGVASLVRARSLAAYRHQIRAHLAAIGHPLFGDRLYGGPDLLGLERHFLHASEIELAHPASGEVMRLVSPLAPDLVAALDRLRGDG